jgi:hypothetical protein
MDTKKLHELLRNVFTATFLLLIATTNSSALDIHVLKAPSDGIEKMKKYSIVRSVDDDGYVIAGTTPATFYTSSSYNQIKFYPNPSASQVNIEGIFTNEEYLIYNLNGTLILKGKLNGLDFIDISRLNSGIYFLELRMNEKIIFREKLSKL